MSFITVGAIIGGASVNWLLLSPLSEIPLPFFIKTAAFSVTLAGLFSAYAINNHLTTASANAIAYPTATHSMSTMWFLSPLSTQALLKNPLILAHQFSKTLDQG